MGSEKRIKLRKGDYILLLLYAYNKEPIRGRTRLQKMCFLFEKEVLKQFKFDKQLKGNKQLELFDFKPYRYGPFSKKVFIFIDLFVNLGLVEIQFEKNEEATVDNLIFSKYASELDDFEYLEDLYYKYEAKEQDEQPVYKLTNEGEKYTKKIWNQLSKKQREALDKLKKSCVELPLKTLLKYIYLTYQEYTTNSEILKEVIGNAI